MSSDLESLTDFPIGMGKVAPRQLIASGIKDIKATINYTEKELLAIHGVGPKAMRILKEELAKNGLELKKSYK